MGFADLEECANVPEAEKLNEQIYLLLDGLS